MPVYCGKVIVRKREKRERAVGVKKLVWKKISHPFSLNRLRVAPVKKGCDIKRSWGTTYAALVLHTQHQ
jgi:hypothetical protein